MTAQAAGEFRLADAPCAHGPVEQNLSLRQSWKLHECAALYPGGQWNLLPIGHDPHKHGFQSIESSCQRLSSLGAKSVYAGNVREGSECVRALALEPDWVFQHCRILISVLVFRPVHRQD